MSLSGKHDIPVHETQTLIAAVATKMSFVRRVKSFSAKKYKSTDELKSEQVPKRIGPGGRRKNLQRERSVSMESVPLHIELEKSDLFHRQRLKLEETQRAHEEKERDGEKTRAKVRRTRTSLTKRKSVSFDEVQFSRCIQELEEREGEVRFRREEREGRGRAGLYKSRYNTIDVIKKSPVHLVRMQQRDLDLDQEPSGRLQHHQTNLVKSKSDWYINLIVPDDDLIANCENDAQREGHDAVDKPATFPLPEQEEVQVRANRIKPEVRPRTYAPTLTRKKDDFLEIRGVSHLEIGRDVCVKFPPKHILRLQDGYLERLDEAGVPTETLRSNVTLKKGAKMLSKTELEIVDAARTIYRLEFVSAKEARAFQDLEKVYHAAPASSSAFKNIGAWSQLRKLLKKRSSRDILESKGIIKNEPIFGNTLEELCDGERPVPEVVTRIVKLIERPENITSVGLYRASANLAVVQNIRFEINCGRWDVLERHRADVDVLAGTLKLFFRELKMPLISREVYLDIHRAITSGGPRSEISKVVELLPRPNRFTLLYIIRHLLKVCQHKDENKMDVHNIAICWGPSLITLPDNCADLVTQTTEFTTITEELLTYYSTVSETLDEPVKPTDFVHDVVRKLTGIVEASIEVEGIYRKSGSNAKIDRMMKMLERGNLEDVDGRSDVHDLCCVLKKYVASVRKSIVPDEFFHAYCEICDKVDDATLREHVHRMVSALPRRGVLRVLFEHLQKVVLSERRNRMSLNILSDIWMTTLLAGVNVQNYKKKMPKYAKLFVILMNPDDPTLPDLVADPRMRIWSSYDNVPDDDIHDDAETGGEKTKL